MLTSSVKLNYSVVRVSGSAIVSVQKVDSPDETNIQRITGIDRGLRQVLTIADDTAHTTFYSGKSLMKKDGVLRNCASPYKQRILNQVAGRLKTIERRENPG